jgi:acetyl esterase/lipase
LLNGTIERVQDGGKMVFGVFHFGGQEVNARLDLISSEPKATIPTHANIPYGPHWQQTFDFYQAESDSPTPVAVAIHGGGWGALDKKNTLGLEKSLLDRGISVASVNYRFIREAEEYGVEPPVKMVMEDAARAIQTLRYLAKELNIDKERIGAAGGSAGGCTSLWIALHDDLADPESENPIARESTRLWCAGGYDPQTSLDPKQMREWIPTITYGAHAYGMKSLDECIKNYDTIKPWIEEYSPYALVSPDDPPIYLSNPMRGTEPEPDEKGWATHSPWFSIKLHEQLKEAGVESYLHYKGNVNPEYGASAAHFFAEILTRETKKN